MENLKKTMIKSVTTIIDLKKSKGRIEFIYIRENISRGQEGSAFSKDVFQKEQPRFCHVTGEKYLRILKNQHRSVPSLKETNVSPQMGLILKRRR